ncbi:MAG: recombinase family protein [Defluviitaleaceae bacterium]|nr:recombinase family protein [Defluviitaleaceae bacterium]MCL2261943.1 recombinase family protein [Defluviitaleaceae bacterium]
MIEARTVWNAYGYTRVSKDDGSKDVSNSIKNQKDLILDFAEGNPDVNIVDVVSDDGATGANFDRTAFKDMINHIESGAVNCVVVKDFSRLGRDHIETGRYIERYFADKNVRFISINDNYDSLRADMSDSSNSLIVPFKNIISEAFLEDISTKTKSHLAVKRKNGEFVCNYAVYGYAKATDKKLVIDDFASEIVKAIFEHKILGYNEQQIAHMLNAKGTLSPAEYKKANGEAYNTPFAIKDKSQWTPNAIRRILTNRVYIGHLEQGKRTKVSYRLKRSFYQPREAWSIHEDKHDAIISKSDFELVQELMTKDTRISIEMGKLHLFSGLIYCGACNQAMSVKVVTKKSGKRYVNYVCATHKRFGTCRNNNISGKKIEEYILLFIRKHVDGLLSADETVDGIGLGELKSRKKLTYERMIEKSLDSIKEYNAFIVKSYVHFLEGVITQKEHDMFRDDFYRQIDDAEKQITHMRHEIERLGDNVASRELIEQFKAFGNITALDRRIVVGTIRSIIVHSNRDIEINLRYGIGFDLLQPSDIHDVTLGKAVV